MKKNEVFKVHVPMNAELTKWLENIGIDARELGGFRIPKTSIIKACIRAVMKYDIDLSKVKTEEDLVKRIEKAIEVSKKKR
ncbi:MAG: hypothetical protein A2452_07420 [Candidatus Firestonebacteria bacterium RIFOXYC2_FULL_39_67]|nr:MAG: hypothetical protein A2452_07420 [Candidatus Firestonebacteria bacterium RIFOXYC2_FULL_39_67]